MLSCCTHRRAVTLGVWFVLVFIIFELYISDIYGSAPESPPTRTPFFPLVHSSPPPVDSEEGKFRWKDLPIQFPIRIAHALPSGRVKSIPRVQHNFTPEDPSSQATRLERLDAVKAAFQHSWRGYRKHAWMADEVAPLSGQRKNPFGGWAASLVDALDTLWITEMREEFEEAVQAIRQIDFTQTEENELNVFETTIRYLGGFLSAYDLSDGQYPLLLTKALELGEMLLVAFDTPNRMPCTRWRWRDARDGKIQEASSGVLVAEIGSLTLEFTRLSQITGDMRFYDAVQRIMNIFDEQQMQTRLPGMWAVVVNAKDLDFRSGDGYTLGAMADSLYEYLPKQHMLLGGRTDQYRTLYTRAADVFTKQNFYIPMTEDESDILFSSLARVDNEGAEPEPKIFDRPQDLETARKLVDGCIWAYQSLDNGLMAEVSHHVACPKHAVRACAYNETLWHAELMKQVRDSGAATVPPSPQRVAEIIQRQGLKPGYTAINDRRYILRPEAIESVFMWYRITGNTTYQDKAWLMFQAIDKHTRTNIANAALDDILASPPTKADRMESFWMAETLKYFYLIFADPNVVSLDSYVFNTEAHPLRRPT